MTWTLAPDISAEKLEHWEATINTIFTPGLPGKIICQYNRHRLPTSVINQAFRTHPFAVIENGVCRNAFYEEPHILDDRSETSKSEWMISQLKKIHLEEKAELSRSLEEKNILLKEIHHRVRNNMQVISSLLRLQSAYIEDDNKSLKVFQECQNRIRSMALVHEALYRTNDFTTLNLNEYIKRLGNELLRSYNLNPEKIKMDVDVDVKAVALDMDTGIACGLILNELMTNSIKYAFPGGRNGKIKVNFSIVDKKANLTVSDNGIGLPKGFEVNNCKTLGMRLVKTLVDQLEGELEIKNHYGTSFKIEFPAIKEA
jgi:two-component sensor histidine kinase